ncbi:hypothetical protein EFK11_20875 [Escherichia coli]|nr:hypothetical protein [Escherichia coli]
MGSCAAPSAKGDDKFITTDYLQQCRFFHCVFLWGCRSQENVSICGAGKYSTFREDSRRRK